MRGQAPALRLIFATAFAVSATLTVSVTPAAAWCRAGVSKWADSTQELWVWNDIPAGWNQAISASRHAWNNIAFDLIYWQPVFEVSQLGTFTLLRTDFSAAGFPDVPGRTYNNLVSQPHTTSTIWLNTDYAWNLNGVMNQAQHKADVRTVLTHEIGHSSGLAHPYDCDPPYSDGEKAAVMWVAWVQRWNPNGDDKSGIRSAYP